MTVNGTLKKVKSSLWVASSVSGLIGFPELLKTNFCLAFLETLAVGTRQFPAENGKNESSKKLIE